MKCFLNFNPIAIGPKPVQTPHPPIYIGGNGTRTFDRVIELGAGWMPSTYRTGDEIESLMAGLQRRAEEAGRGPIPVTVSSVPVDPAWIERYEKAGVERVIFRLPPVSADEGRPLLKEMAEMMGRFR